MNEDMMKDIREMVKEAYAKGYDHGRKQAKTENQKDADGKHEKQTLSEMEKRIEKYK